MAETLGLPPSPGLAKAVFQGAHSLVDLQAAINRIVTEHNQTPKPFVWTADPDRIIEAVKRGHQTLDSLHFREIRTDVYIRIGHSV